MSEIEDHVDDMDIIAAQYVLGTLDLDERDAFSARLATDPSARRAVSAWERRFDDLALDGETAMPSPDVWARIERAIRASSVPSSPSARPFDLVAGGAAFLATPRLRASRNRWRAAAILSGSIAAALLVFVGDRAVVGVQPAPDDVTYVAAVNRGGDKPALLVRVDLKTRQVFVRPVAAETPAGRSLELWYIGDGKPPRPMGLVDTTPSTLAIPRGASATDATFAVSVEPVGGSKTGAPTGPVVYSGSLIKE